ncbi:MAG: glycosyltransferase, partial [Clostridiales bacterium]|nr:glycosyltransferase [Clostridiales bacterium]
MKTIVFAGGGTAGHVMPNIALIDQLKHDYNCVYVGGDGMEKDICEARNIP